MKHATQSPDEKISQVWHRLENAYSNQAQPSPSESIDKQIIAAAYRENNLSRKSAAYRTKGLRKIALPLYVAAGFAFTVFAFKSLWHPPGYIMEQQTTQPTQVQVNTRTLPSTQVALPATAFKQPPSQLPQLVVAPDASVVTSKEPTTTYLLEQQALQSMNEVQIEPAEQTVYTGTHLTKALYPEKQAWAYKIIDLMKKNESQAARSELIQFKKVYPDFPIEEQIKGLSSQ